MVTVWFQKWSLHRVNIVMIAATYCFSLKKLQVLWSPSKALGLSHISVPGRIAMFLLGLPQLWVGLGHSIPMQMHHTWPGASLQKLCGSLQAGKEPRAGLVCSIHWFVDIDEADWTSWKGPVLKYVGTFSSS